MKNLYFIGGTMYDKLNTVKIDVSDLTPEEVADRILGVRFW